MPFWHFPDSMTQDLNTMISSCPTFWMIPKKSMPSLTFTPPFRATGGTTPYTEPFWDICIDSQDPLIFHASDVRVRQSMDIAMRLGRARRHFSHDHIANFRLKSYREDWLKKNSAYWRRLLAEYPALTVYLENMFDEEPDLLRRLAEDLSDEPRFGVCYDMAHAYLSQTPLTDWNQALLPYVCHLHINDNDKTQDTHRPVGSGSLPWDLYAQLFASCPPGLKPSVLIEVRSYEDLAASVSYLKEHHLHPFG